MSDFTYHPMHMHLHAACDHGASMALHMHSAHQLGMRYIWFTDHDTRMGPRKRWVTGFSFDDPELQKEAGPAAAHGFYPEGERLRYDLNPKEKLLKLTLEAGEEGTWEEGSLRFFSIGSMHTRALAADVTLEIDLPAFTPSPDQRLIFDVQLSQRPPDCQKAHLLYVLGSTQGLEAPHTQVIPLAEAGHICLPISRDASAAIGGRDNAFDTLIIRLQAKNHAQAEACLREFRIRECHHFEALHQALKQVASAAAAPYEITPFVSFELSGVWDHMNCFGTHVPVLDYAQRNFSIPVEEATAHIRDHGGIYAFNHPLAIGSLKRKIFTPVERMQVMAKMQAALTACNAYGAKLLEVGFPEGRNGFILEEFLFLWDMLAMSGIFLTGYGSSDSHRDNVGWFSGNNFATWIGVPETLPHPVPEKAFQEALAAGRVYTGDPVILRGKVDFRTAAGHPMGSMFPVEKTPELDLVFTAEQTRPGWIFRLVENGLVTHTQEIEGESFRFDSRLIPGRTAVNFQRAELWDENGRCVLITNPIYLINTKLLNRALPAERLQQEVTI